MNYKKGIPDVCNKCGSDDFWVTGIQYCYGSLLEKEKDGVILDLSGDDSWDATPLNIKCGNCGNIIFYQELSIDGKDF